MKRVPLKNPIYYCEYYRGIMFQLLQSLNILEPEILGNRNINFN